MISIFDVNEMNAADKENMEYIAQFHAYYAEELFDFLITAEKKNLDYDALDVYRIFEDILIFKQLYFRENIKSIYTYLKKIGNSKKDIRILSHKSKISCRKKTNFKAANLDRCIERIFAVFCERTDDFLISVLSDNEEDPHYSPNMLYSHIERILQFKKSFYEERKISVEDYLFQKGYEQRDIELLYERKKRETQLYPEKFRE